jgi:hypothetical protein
MLNSQPSKLYTYQELKDEVEGQRKRRLEHGIKIGDFRVYFRIDLLTIQIDHQDDFLYEIDLESCNTNSELLAWIFQIHGKTWGESVLSSVLTTIDDACHVVHGKSMKYLFLTNQKLSWRAS